MQFELDAATELVLSVAIASTNADEELGILQDGRPLAVREILDQHGTRLHVADAEAGRVTVTYRVHQVGDIPAPALDPVDLIRYLRPSRYCESDALFPTARSEFAGLSGHELLNAVSSWVGQHLAYVPGSSLPTDGAVRTLLSRQGVCRDYAHLVIAMLRALDVPARMASVYAPGLDPMDFHAVAEAWVEGGWYVVDATSLAPRQSLMRIATGRDAADTAFLSNSGGWLTGLELEVGAVVDILPRDDISVLVQLA
jgi:transglutaminase-like putative cysteine protease